MIIDRVTVTGADDSVTPGALLVLQRKYPFVEWGILVSKKQEGTARFPTRKWIEALASNMDRDRRALTLCAHVCGIWVRRIMVGDRAALDELPVKGSPLVFDRAQLNFHAEPHAYSLTGFVGLIQSWGIRQYILQADGMNDRILVAVAAALRRDDLVVPLFDQSGGAGVEPARWPTPADHYAGYAGGLHPDKVVDQLARIRDAVGQSTAPIWIDVETHVRSDQDQRFDLDKVDRFLSAVEPFVSGGGR